MINPPRLRLRAPEHAGPGQKGWATTAREDNEHRGYLLHAPRLREALVDLSEKGAKQVTVDLAEMEFIDSTGLSVLMAAWKRMRENGGDLALQSPSASAMKVFEITGATRVFTITGTPVAATNRDGGRNGEASFA